MLCYIYRSNKKTGAYLYMARQDDFDCLPDAMRQVFGEPEFSMSLDLTADKKLAQEDIHEVIGKLKSEGYYLQLPKAEFDVRKIEDQIIASLKTTKSQ